MDVTEFSYELPDSAIAQHPVEPRDNARLLEVEGLVDHRFSDLPTMLSAGDLLVVNRTRVRASRLLGTRATGGGAEVLLLRPLARDQWTALVRPAKKLPSGSIIVIGDLEVTVVEHHGEGVATVRLAASGPVEDAIAAAGTMPLPPYITESLDHPDDYQTVYARELGSAAAPTAGLHFTESLLNQLEKVGVRVSSVVLEVGLDTFRPITTDRIEDHEIHSERIVVEPEVVEVVEETRVTGGRVVAVGTTVVRALESAAAGGSLVPFSGATDLYITPGYRCRVVDGLITNFHLPRTTLLVMIAALFGDRWRDIYTTALERGYRFLSFGDAMFGWVR